MAALLTSLFDSYGKKWHSPFDKMVSHKQPKITTICALFKEKLMITKIVAWLTFGCYSVKGHMDIYAYKKYKKECLSLLK